MKILGQSLISKIETAKNKSIRRLITFKKKLNYSSDIFFFFFNLRSMFIETFFSFFFLNTLVIADNFFFFFFLICQKREKEERKIKRLFFLSSRLEDKEASNNSYTYACKTGSPENESSCYSFERVTCFRLMSR